MKYKDKSVGAHVSEKSVLSDLKPSVIERVLNPEEYARKRREKEMEVLDWSIRQLRALGFIGMREMILVLRVMSLSMGRSRVFSDKQIKALCRNTVGVLSGQSKTGQTF